MMTKAHSSARGSWTTPLVLVKEVLYLLEDGVTSIVNILLIKDILKSRRLTDRWRHNCEMLRFNCEVLVRNT